MAKIYFRETILFWIIVLQKMNNILGIQAESQIIKTETTQLSTLIHYRKFFYENQTFANDQNQDFVVGNIFTISNYSKTECVCSFSTN
jgi:hypothetical protein